MPAVRQRNAGKTRSDILSAAQTLFSQHGYDGASLRDIAALAGVNVALVNRYFGSKERLFVEAVGERFILGDLIEGDRAGFGERLARHVIEKDEAGRLDSVAALLVSAPNGQAADFLREQLESQFIHPLAAWLGGKNTKLRASMIASELLGLVMLRDIVRLSQMNGRDTKALIQLLAKSLQMHVDAG